MLKKLVREYYDIVLSSSTLLLSVAVFNILSYIFQITMARGLSVVEFGELGAILSLVYFFSIPSEMIGTAIIDMDKTKEVLAYRQGRWVISFHAWSSSGEPVVRVSFLFQFFFLP